MVHYISQNRHRLLAAEYDQTFVRSTTGVQSKTAYDVSNEELLQPQRSETRYGYSAISGHYHVSATRDAHQAYGVTTRPNSA